MSTTEFSSMCQEVEERLSEVLDGTASQRLFDHIASCDACRDLRYEATHASELVGGSGKDFRPAEDFLEKLVARLEEARPDDHAAPVASAPRESAPREPVSRAVDSGNVVIRSTATSPGIGMETAATVFDPLAAAKAEEQEAESRRPVKSGPREVGSTQPGIGEQARPSGVSATTHHTPISGAGSKPVSPTIEEHLDTRAAVDAVIEAEPAAAPIKAVASDAKERAPEPARRSRGKVSLLRRPALLAGAAGVLAAAAAVTFYLKRTPTTEAPIGPAPWWGTVASVARASADKTGGLEACDGAGACAVVVDGAKIPKGSTLRTDARTRAHVTLADGTDLAMDRGSELALSKDKDRSARLKRGTIVADVTHVDGQTAHFWFPSGDVEVIGTKLSISASDDRASVEVARGTVRVRPDGGKWTEVRAGEEATLLRGQDTVVASSTSIADVMEWSDRKAEDVDAPVLRGLGELRARKPGQTKEKDHAVRLAKHAVKVRVVDVVARTEVDETFANDTDEELEGIFRFPLPPGAQIEKLSLEVDGKMIDGAFVDRDKGAAIWRGVIQNAAPTAVRPREEIIWVPGPWRDPALLEWQRGGRFELKIFPIPKRGSRRVALTYTQTVDQSAGVRRFTYPLAHDPSGTTKVGSFDLDVQVLGLDKTIGLQTRGYDLAAASGDADRRTMHADDFVPAGDLTVEYALPDRDKEATAWAYEDISRPPAITSSALSRGKAQTAEEKAAFETAATILNDGSPYAAIALRPKLPRWTEAKERLHVIVVDSSRSMFGERFARARLLASSIVREMDRRDSFVVLACDTTCRAMTGESAGSAKPEAPGASAAENVERFLGGIEPDGGSDIAAAMSSARTAAGPVNGKELRVIYLGDGTPSVGPTRPAHLEAAVKSAMPSGDGAVVAVALGADADMTSLAALARGGGGVVVPYVPGQKVATAALEALGAAYGVVLRDVEVELPAGLSQVSPARIDPIRAGGETILVARMSGSNLGGTIKIRGRVAGERFEQSYPLNLKASTSAGNAFVPRLFAAAKIADLERAGDESQKATVIELSKRFAVASRFTSLLVLESEAMFKAFGLDRTASAPSFTGEVGADSSTADAEGEVADQEEARGGKDKAKNELGGGSAEAKKSADSANAYGGDDEGSPQGFGSGHGRLSATKGGGGGFAPPPPVMPSPAATSSPADPFAAAPMPSSPVQQAPRSPAKVAGGPLNPWESPPRDRGRRLVPMRKVFDRKVSFDVNNTFVAQNASKLLAAESAIAASPDSRDKTIDLFAMYSTAGRLGEAQELSAKWSGRDALDPDALTARADLAARQGDRDRAVRILGGLADVRPNDRAVQTRLAELQENAGNLALACEHRLALADIAMSDAKLVADAVRCSRSQGMLDLASRIELDTTDKVREAVTRLLVAPNPAQRPLAGDVQVSAEWSGGADLDVALIDAQGKRTSWMGSPSKATTTARDVTSQRNETLAISALPQGNYVVEISRAGGQGADTASSIRGEVTLRLGGDVRKLPFTLAGPRAEVGTVRVFFTSRLVPVDFGFGGWR
jgi:vault protein inter-alpha-trypsin-like protein/FecR-like protein/VWA domain-containing protein